MNRVAVGRHTLAPEVLVLAESAIAAGGLLIYPTDTLYAIGGSALDAAAALAVRAAKGRDDAKPLPVVAGSVADAARLCRSWPPQAAALAEAFWPGPLTLVVPAAACVPDGVGAGTGTIAVRVPGHDVCRLLLARVGPLVATSANRSGNPPPLTCAEAIAEVGGAVALALDAGPGSAAPSTLVDLTGPQPALLREGPVAWSDVRECLERDPARRRGIPG